MRRATIWESNWRTYERGSPHDRLAEEPPRRRRQRGFVRRHAGGRSRGTAGPHCHRAAAAVFEKGQEHRVDLPLGTNARELMRPLFPTPEFQEGITAQFVPLAERALHVYGIDSENAAAAPDPVYGDAMAQWATDAQ